jgi:hypothetical protein
MNKRTAISLVFLLTYILYSNRCSAQDKKAMSLKIDYGITMMYSFKEHELIQALHLAPNISKRNHEFYVGPILVGPSGGLFLGATAGYKYHIIHDPGRINMFVFYDFIYFQETFKASSQWFSHEMITYKYDYGLHMAGFGFNINLDKNNRFSINNSIGFLETFVRYKPSRLFSTLTSSNYGYGVCFSLGFICRMKTWEKRVDSTHEAAPV